MPENQHDNNNQENPHGAKDRIIEAAIKLFCSTGYHATSVREIVEEAGVSKPVLYYYFKNKEDLFKSIINGFLDGIYFKIQKVCSAVFENFKDQLKAIEEIYYDYARNSPNIIRFIDAISYSGVYDKMVDFNAHWYKCMELMTKIFEDAGKKGILKSNYPPAIQAALFHGMVLHKTNGYIFVPDFMKKHNTENAVTDILLNGLALESKENISPVGEREKSY